MNTDGIKEWQQKNPKEAKAASKLMAVMAIVIAFAIMGPLLGLAATGLINAIAVIIGAIVTVVLIQIAPWMSKWLTMKGNNFFLDRMKKEAMDNPIATLQNKWMNDGVLLQEENNLIAETDAEARTLGDRLRKMKREFQGEDQSDMEASLADMNSAITERRAEYVVACQLHQEKGKKLQFAQSKWEFAIASGKLAAKIDPAGRTKFLNQLLEETALDSIDRKYNESYSRLVMRRTQQAGNSPPQLEQKHRCCTCGKQTAGSQMNKLRWILTGVVILLAIGAYLVLDTSNTGSTSSNNPDPYSNLR